MMDLIKKKTPKEWLEIAKERIINILIMRLICTQSQLESKICEAGPTNQRPFPTFLTTARNLLRDERKIKFKKTSDQQFFYLAGTDIENEDFKARFDRIQRAHIIYTSMAKKPECCGIAFEALVQGILQETKVSFTGDYREGDIKSFNGIRLANNYPLKKDTGIDFILHVDKVHFGVETKNQRRWIEGSNQILWEHILKCCILGVVPVFVSRKIFFTVSTNLFAKVGVFGHQTQHQYFHDISGKLNLKNELAEAKAKDGLGFHDIVFEDTNSKGYIALKRGLKKFLSETILKNGEKFKNQFEKVKKVLKKYAQEEGLASKKLRGEPRNKIYLKLMNELNPR